MDLASQKAENALPRREGRYRFLDYVKGFAILSVVLGHLFATVSGGEPWPESHIVFNRVVLNGMVKLFSIYELAVFFMVSGFLLAEKDLRTLNLRQFLFKRARKYLTIYLVFSFLYIFMDVTLKNAIYVVTGYGLSVLWFLPTLTVAEAVFLLLQKGLLRVTSGKWSGGLPAVCSLVLAGLACYGGAFVQGLEGEEVSAGRRLIGCFLVLLLRGLVGQFFVFLGGALRAVLKRVTARWLVPVSIVFLVVGILCGLRIPVADWRVMDMQAPAVWLACASLLGIGLILFFFGLDRFRLRLLELLGRESLLIMCTHLQFGIMPQCILLGYRFSSKLPSLENILFWAITLFFLGAMETVLILLKKYAYRY